MIFKPKTQIVIYKHLTLFIIISVTLFITISVTLFIIISVKTQLNDYYYNAYGYIYMYLDRIVYIHHDNWPMY